MSSFEDRFYLENPTFIEKVRRNARLLLSLLIAAAMWLFKGFRLRRALRKASQEGATLKLEDWTDQ
ncbi:MAG: hypothetical protein AB8B48_12860 [Pseudomonadales bacterium]